MRKFPIIKVLVKNHVLTQESAQRLMIEGEKSKVSEYELLQTQNMSEESILNHLSKIFHLPIMNIEHITISEESFGEIPDSIFGQLQVLPIKSTETEITIAISDPTDIAGLESLSYYTSKQLVFVLAKPSLIVKQYQLHTSQSKSNEAVESLIQEFDTENDFKFDKNIEDNTDAPTIQLTNSILLEAIISDASDIHVEPYEKEMVIRYRVDGVLKEIMRLPMSVYSALIARFKLICGMDISERRIPQEGRLEVTMRDLPVDIRFSTIPNVYGEKLVMRILQKKFLNTEVQDIGFNAKEYELVTKMLKSPNGIILVTGPTGSGKSTTLYSFLNFIKTSEKSIVTVEDPVEYTIEGFNQTQVNTRQGLTFPICLRAILRQDPDIIMIGEIRDEETAEIAVRASITGHLVLSTLHTNTSVSSISRLINMGIEPYLIADSLRGVIAQRLVRRLCPDCKEQRITNEMEMRYLHLNKPQTIYHPKGCKTCSFTGYRKRFAIFEVLYITPEIKRSIQNTTEVSQIEQKVMETDFQKLYDSGIDAVLRGDTSLQELRGVQRDE